MNPHSHEAPLFHHIKTTLHHDKPLAERVRALRARRRKPTPQPDATVTSEDPLPPLTVEEVALMEDIARRLVPAAEGGEEEP